MIKTPVVGFLEYDRCQFVFSFPGTQIAGGGISTLVLSPTCDNIVFTVVERLFIPGIKAKDVHVEYVLVHSSDSARELIRDMDGEKFAFNTSFVSLKHVFRPYETIILTVRNKSGEPVDFRAAIAGWAYDAGRTTAREWSEKVFKEREALCEHIKKTEMVFQCP